VDHLSETGIEEENDSNVISSSYLADENSSYEPENTEKTENKAPHDISEHREGRLFSFLHSALSKTKVIVFL
jgi:hypothetical protein